MNTSPAPSRRPERLSARLKRLLPYFAGSQWALLLAAGATIVGALTDPLIPGLFKPLLDQGFQVGSLALWMVPAALIALFALRGLMGFAADYSLAHAAQVGMVRLRRVLFAKLQQADISLFTQHSASSLANTVVYEVQTGATLLINALLGSIKDAFSLLALLGYLFYLNWQLTCIAGLLVPAVGWVMRVLSRRLHRITRNTQHATDELAYVVEENVLAHRIVRLHAAQEAQARRFDTLSLRLRLLGMKATIATAAMTPVTQMFSAVTLSAVIATALWQSATSGTTVGGFAAFVTAMLMLIAPIKRLSEVAGPVTRGLAALERALDLIEHTPEETSGAHQAACATGALQLQDVLVRYQPERPPALDHVSLDIAPGQVVALVGPSGAGKTTLVNLLPRFVQPSAGRVLLDGVDLAQWDLRTLRRQIAMVSQDVVMLNDSLAANVALGQSVDAPRVEHCLRAANLGDYLAGLPAGIATVVGHNAGQLSGGQRQRLAIARALYKDAPILILDEATSALDTESEKLVQQALRRLMAGRTTLVIAHRLSTIEHADRVVVLAQGRIAEQGTHEELTALNGLYARLHRLGFTETADTGATST